MHDEHHENGRNKSRLGARGSRFRPFDLTGLKTFDLSERPSKVAVADLGKPLEPDAAFLRFLDRLPDQLAAKSLRRLCDHFVRVKSEGGIVAAAIGGHVVKTGCGPYLIDWMRQGMLDALSMNGAAAIHDLELAIAGKTSEDVGPRLIDGTFGMARQTAEIYAEAARRARDSEIGLGRALGEMLDDIGCPHAGSSLLIQAARHGVACTVHVAMGTDVVHMHPCMDGAALGAATLHDFRVLTTVVSKLARGMWLNIGCAVIMPEVFLKAVSVARNFGHDLDGLVTANFDMIQQYRGRVNVCERPGDEGILLTGHHEIMLPLVHAAVAAKMALAEIEPQKRAA